jgi:hypothetical protein
MLEADALAFSACIDSRGLTPVSDGKPYKRVTTRVADAFFKDVV